MEFCKVTLTFESMEESYDVTIQMKALCLYKILENEIRKFGRNLPLATFGSERVKSEYNMANVRLRNRRIIPIRFVILDIRTS